jgi:S-adenosyl methyltransferase
VLISLLLLATLKCVSTTSRPAPGIDTDIPAVARIYDYWLGGQDHFAADRIAALKVAAAAPEAPLLAVENRRFLRRTIRYLVAEAGITQFLDIGTGLPTQGNVHQIAQEVRPGARVVYVDNDAMVVAHSRVLKTGPDVTVIHADLREPQAILEHADTRRLIDFSQPLAVLMIAVLHFISDADDPAGAIAAFRDTVPAGSYLAISHVTSDIRGQSAASASVEYKKIAPDATLRSRSEILQLFAGFELLDPGLVQLPYWRPDDPPSPGADYLWILGGVGRKSGAMAFT